MELKFPDRVHVSSLKTQRSVPIGSIFAPREIGSELVAKDPGEKHGQDGEGEVKGWKWAGDLRVQVCIIAALIFVIWMVLQQQYY
jgi:hypothetical protein